MADPRIDEIQKLLPRAMLADWVRLGARLVRLLRDRHHPDLHERILEHLLTKARDSVALREQRQREVRLLKYSPVLPIASRNGASPAATRNPRVIVVAGETGAGTTTQI